MPGSPAGRCKAENGFKEINAHLAELLKQNQKDAVSADTDQAEKDSSDDTGKQDPKSEQTR